MARTAKKLSRVEARKAYLAAEFPYATEEHGLDFVEQFAGIGESNACAQLDEPETDYYTNVLDTVGEYTDKAWSEAKKRDAFNVADHAFFKAGGKEC